MRMQLVSRCLKKDWPQQNNVNVFVTGGTGFFGKALLRFWQKNNPQFKKIYLLSRSPETFLENNSDLVKGLPIEFVKGNVLNLSERNFNQVFNVVLHAATDSTIGPSLTRLDLYSQITKGTEEILEFATRHNCRKFVLTSSGGVYGAQPSHLEKIPEDYLGMPDPLDPNSAYGIGKRAAEHLTALYADKYGFDYVIARCFAFVGEDLPLDKHFAIGNFISNAINGKDLVINGDGAPLRSYLYQHDLASCINVLLFNKTKYNVYNVGSDIEISIEGLATKIRDKYSSGKKIILKRKSDSNIKNRYIPNIDRLKSEFFQSEFMSLDASLDETIKKLKK